MLFRYLHPFMANRGNAKQSPQCTIYFILHYLVCETDPYICATAFLCLTSGFFRWAISLNLLPFFSPCLKVHLGCFILTNKNLIMFPFCHSVNFCWQVLLKPPASRYIGRLISFIKKQCDTSHFTLSFPYTMNNPEKRNIRLCCSLSCCCLENMQVSTEKQPVLSTNSKQTCFYHSGGFSIFENVELPIKHKKDVVFMCTNL